MPSQVSRSIEPPATDAAMKDANAGPSPLEVLQSARLAAARVGDLAEVFRAIRPGDLLSTLPRRVLAAFIRTLEDDDPFWAVMLEFLGQLYPDSSSGDLDVLVSRALATIPADRLDLARKTLQQAMKRFGSPAWASGAEGLSQI